MERKIKQVTSNSAEIADSAVLNEIADATNDVEQYEEIMTITWERLDQKPKDWRIIYKVFISHLFILFLINHYHGFSFLLDVRLIGNSYSEWEFKMSG